ncbi:MAG: septum formation initiator family protein [Candidatus Paceibacterota bacterium]
MTNLLRKKKYRHLLFSKVGIGIVLVLALLVSRAAWNVYEKERLTRAKLNEAERELVELEAREAVLQEDIATLETPAGVEEEIRTTYGFAKEGEEVLVILEEETEPLNFTHPKPTLWQRIVSLFR